MLIAMSHLVNRFGFSSTAASLIFCTAYGSSNVTQHEKRAPSGKGFDWSIFQKYKSSSGDAEEMEMLRQKHFIQGSPFKNGYTKCNDNVIGKGGYGQVFRCIDTEQNTYAIKRLAKPQTGYKCMHYNYGDGVADEYDFVKEMHNNKTHYMLVPSLEYDRTPVEVLKTNVTFECALQVQEMFGEFDTVPLELGATTLHDVLVETLIQKSISHENVIGIHECYEDHENYYIVMEYVEGEDLFDVLMSKKNPFYQNEKETMKIINQIVNGLKAIHEAGFGHYDLTMQNIIIYKENGEWKIKIIDFGLAGHVKSFLTRRGTRDETAPEQSVYKKEDGTYKVVYNQRADFWSIGYICYMMLCGYRPFVLDGKDRPDLRFYNEETINFYSNFFKGHNFEKLSEQCKSLISLCLRFDPKQRLSFDKDLLPLLKKRSPKSMQRVMETSWPSHKTKTTGKHLSVIFTNIQDVVRKWGRSVESHKGRYDVVVPKTIPEHTQVESTNSETVEESSDSSRSDVSKSDSKSSSPEKVSQAAEVDIPENSLVHPPQDAILVDSKSSEYSSSREWAVRRRLAEYKIQAKVLRDFAKSKKNTA